MLFRSPVAAAQSPQFRFQVAQPRRERRALFRFSSRACFGFLARARFRHPRFRLALRPFRFPLRAFRCSPRAFLGFLARPRFRFPRFRFPLRAFRLALRVSFGLPPRLRLLARAFRRFRRLPHHRRILAERRTPLVVADHVVAFHPQP